MSDGPTDSDRPSFGERIDPRPAPKYGEYAPPGWVSPVPPVEEPTVSNPAARPGSRSSIASGIDAAGERPPGAPRGYDAPPPTGAPIPGAPPTARPAGGANRVATIALLLYGLFSVVSDLFSTSSFASRTLAQLSTFGYPSSDFGNTAALHTAGAVTAIATLVAYVFTAIWTMRRFRAGRTSWVVPLVAGLVMNVATGVVVAVVLMSDPSFAAFVGSSRG